LWFFALPFTPVFLPPNPVPVATVLRMAAKNEANFVEMDQLGMAPMLSVGESGNWTGKEHVRAATEAARVAKSKPVDPLDRNLDGYSVDELVVEVDQHYPTKSKSVEGSSVVPRMDL
jgi:hypothetical protein